MVDDLLARIAAAQAREANVRTENRLRFPFATQAVDDLREAGIDAKVRYATNAAGETVGSPQPEHGWIPVEQIIRAADWVAMVANRRRRSAA